MKKLIKNQNHRIKTEFVSPLFVQEKLGSEFCLILNLKKLKKKVKYKKTKMEVMAWILSLIRPDTFMAKLDIKDAYHSVPIHQWHTLPINFITK